MTLESRKRDVTEHVVGKLKDGEIQLYHEDQPIGKMTLPLPLQLELEPNYHNEENKIIQNYTSTEGKEARYTDCDEGGWC